jgi:predicted RNA-binding Zn-ribbon protein involved in translation (DUF1610 family)
MKKECVRFDHYYIIEYKESKHVPGLIIEEINSFRCPRCNTTHKCLDHGESMRCDICGLNLELWGNGLYIW